MKAAEFARPRSIGAFPLAVLLAAPSILVVIFLVAVVRPHLDEQARAGFTRRATSLAQVYANAVEPGVEFDDPEHVTEVLGRLAETREVAWATVWVAGDRPFGGWTAPGTAPSTSRPAERLAYGYDVLRVTEPIGGGPGVLELAVPLAPLKEQLRSNILIEDLAAAAVTVVGIACGCLAAVFLRRRRRAEDALRLSEASFRQLIERSPDGLLVHRDGRIVYANATVTRFLARDTLRGLRVMDLVHPEDRLAARSALADLATPDAVAPLRECRLLREDGASLVAEVTGLRVTFEGSPAILDVVRDITERRQLHQRLMLSDRMASVGTLAAGVAHEINNPLTYVLGNLAYARGELRRAKQSAGDLDLDELLTVLEEAHSGGEQVRAIVRDLKTFSRDDRETRVPVDLHKVIDSALNLAGNEIKHRAVLVKEYGDVPEVLANESRLGQVFLNLLVNAAQAIPAGVMDQHQIRVRTRVDAAGQVAVEVADTGGGIPSGILQRIFDPFFTTKPVGVGTGLGLSICHAIVRSLGGDISVTSRVGEGTTFRVVLPAAPTREHDDELADAAEAGAGAASPSPGRILIVDDEPHVASAIGRLLEGHEVEVMTDSRAALERLCAGPTAYDVILCDLMMPSLSGMDLYDALEREAPAALERIVFITGGAFTSSASEFLQRVPNERLEKPLSARQLAETLGARL